MLRRLYAAVGVVAAALALASCGGSGGDAPCMQISGASEIISRAAVLVLDVYGPEVDCAAAPSTVAPLTQRFLPSDAITLNVPPGPHTILLRAYADSAGTVELGSGCTQINLAPGAPVCISLGVAPADAGVDAAAGDASTGNLCAGSSCPCEDDGDCSDAALPRCGPEHTCVACRPASDNCPTGQYCVAGSLTCAPGCKNDEDCAGAAVDGGAPLPLCDTTRHQCVQCLQNSDCPVGQLCSASGACVDGCDPAQGRGCAAGLTCCNKECLDTQTDVMSCGACDAACNQLHSLGAACTAGACTYTGCAAGYGDCAASAPDRDGCETDLAAGGKKLCGATCVATSACCTADECTTPPSPAACYDATCASNSCGYPLKTGAKVCGGTCCLGVHGTCGSTCSLSCDSGYANCNGSVSDGCEASLNSASNCHGCGQACGSGQACFASCCAIPITANGSYDGDTSGSTNQHSTNQCGGSTIGDGHDLMYALTAVKSSTITVDTCTSDFDTVLYVRTSCDTDTLGCSDDASNCGGWGSRVSFAAQAGVTYYIVVDGVNNGDDGSFTLTVSGM